MAPTILKDRLVDKYQPKVLGDLIGTKQQEMARILEKNINNGRLPSSVLLFGPPGVGKTTTARIIGLCLNCDNGPTSTPCGLCQPCLWGGQRWRLECSAAGAKAVKIIEGLLEDATMRIFRDKFPVIVVDEVDLITTTNAPYLQSKIVKPPSNVTFVLCTNNFSKVPEPIRSRCQRYELPKVGDREMIDFLGKIATQEGTQLRVAQLAEIARFADGRPRDALHELEKDL